ncbi:hypothetical protein Q5O24_06300 [Eubacteriaceae bacterium ES3]|nr:hypothetical protein Q5O24_06300 [Eubacteriaceae bacterium ES3]
MKKHFEKTINYLVIVLALIYMFPLSVNANPIIDPPLPVQNSPLTVFADEETDNTSDSTDDTTQPEDETDEETELVQPSIQYCTHIQDNGWLAWAQNDEISGTVGQGLRMEAYGISLSEGDYDLDIEYQSFVENFAWLGIRNSGQGSGTEGFGLRLEATHIELTGEDADLFDIYYQVHAENIGWMGWAKNGENAGTCDLGLRLEAIRIIIQPVGTAAPGETDNHFIQG